MTDIAVNDRVVNRTEAARRAAQGRSGVAREGLAVEVEDATSLNPKFRIAWNDGSESWERANKLRKL